MNTTLISGTGGGLGSLNGKSRFMCARHTALIPHQSKAPRVLLALTERNQTQGLAASGYISLQIRRDDNLPCLERQVELCLL